MADRPRTKPYRGPLKAVVFDWAGTMIDFGSCAPVGVFVDVFRRFGIEISTAEARAPMGLPKRDHIKALLDTPRLRQAWTKVHGKPPTTVDLEALYGAFAPLGADVAVDYCDLVPGAADVAAMVRRRGLKVGSTTGYTRAVMDRVMPLARDQGYQPELVVCADDLPWGRPTPMAMYKCLLELGVWPAAAVVKVDDTAPGISEGNAAGCWTVGVTLSGNYVGLSHEDVQRLNAEDRVREAEAAAERLWEAGADFVIDTVASLETVLDEIESRLNPHHRSN